MTRVQWVSVVLALGVGVGAGLLIAKLDRTPPYFQRVKVTSVATPLPTAPANVTEASVRFNQVGNFTPLQNAVDTEPGVYGSTRYSYTSPNMSTQVTSFELQATIDGGEFKSGPCELPQQWHANYIDVVILGMDNVQQPVAIWRAVRTGSWQAADVAHTGWYMVRWQAP